MKGVECRNLREGKERRTWERMRRSFFSSSLLKEIFSDSWHCKSKKKKTKSSEEMKGRWKIGEEWNWRWKDGENRWSDGRDGRIQNQWAKLETFLLPWWESFMDFDFPLSHCDFMPVACQLAGAIFLLEPWYCIYKTKAKFIF